MNNLIEIFTSVKNTLLAHTSLSEEEFEKALEPFQHYGTRQLEDQDYFQLLTLIPFYSGFKASTVDKAKPIILKCFPSPELTASLTDDDVNRIKNIPGMISNSKKIQGIIHNANEFKEIIDTHGSFKKYVESFDPKESLENLFILKEDLQFRFKYLGKITVYHFLTDIGMDVLKPDRVITRIFYRLGLIRHEQELFRTILIGKKIADSISKPIRYVDIILVKFGQVGASQGLGIPGGICLEKTPRCSVCMVREFCQFEAQIRRTTPSG